jgi:cation:H+ antiporter
MIGGLLGETVWVLLLLVMIVGVCQLFSNAVEWLGEKLDLSQGVVGSVLAAVGTALPETIVPLVALLPPLFGAKPAGGHGGHGEAIGVGAILGAPYMLITLGMVVIGTSVAIASLRGKRSTQLNIQAKVAQRDMHFFWAAFSMAIIAGFLPAEFRWVHYVFAALLIALYGVYLKVMFTSSDEPATGEDLPEGGAAHPQQDAHALAPLYFAPKAASPTLPPIVIQIALALVLLVVIAHWFVDAISLLSTELHIPAFLMSLVIVPVATELPEKFNSFFWCQQGKDTLAVGNMTGAMVFQSCIPVSVGLLMTDWRFDTLAGVNVMVCLIASLWVYFLVFRNPSGRHAAYLLMFTLVFYLAYLGYMLLGGQTVPAPHA